MDWSHPAKTSHKYNKAGTQMEPSMHKVWALSLHTCSSLEAALDEMLVNSGHQGNEHKEEKKARIENDNKG